MTCKSIYKIRIISFFTISYQVLWLQYLWRQSQYLFFSRTYYLSFEDISDCIPFQKLEDVFAFSISSLCVYSVDTNSCNNVIELKKRKRKKEDQLLSIVAEAHSATKTYEELELGHTA